MLCLVSNIVVLTCKCRTVAVKLKGQPPVAVARAEGSEAYKSVMRMESTPASGKVYEYDTWCYLYELFAPLSLQDYLGYCRGDPDPDVHAVQALFYDLKRAAEAHLGHALCPVSISLLDRNAVKGRLEEIIDAALATLGLAQAVPIKPYAHAMALQHHGLYVVDGAPEVDFSISVLAIESSSSGVINLDLPALGYTGGMLIRNHHNITGTEIPPQCLGEDNNPANCTSAVSQRRRAIREAITKLTTPPFGEPWEEIPTTISNVVVYGDAANDTVLHEELLALFGPDRLAIVEQPTYAAALYAATHAFLKINDVSYFDNHLSSWCCLKSWGKACPGNPQRIDL